MAEYQPEKTVSEPEPMSLLSKLFGGAKPTETAAISVEHQGFAITPIPIREGSRYRISARIDKVVAGEARSHTLIRADVTDSYDDAAEASVRKAKQMIDEQGERLFA